MKYLVLLISFSFLVGCQAIQNPNSTMEETSSLVASQFQMVLRVEGEDVMEENLAFQPGEKLLDVMKKYHSIMEKDGFVERIDQYEQNPSEMKYWLFEVNGQMSQVGANQVELKEGDKVVWSLSVLE